jgi:signal transduction histidine kinase
MLLDEEFGPLSESHREPLEMMNESACHLRAITNNLLLAARLEAGKMKLDMQPRDLPSLVRAAAVGFDLRLKAKAQCLELHVAPDLPLVLCDESKAMQVIGNLLRSACQRAPEGAVIRISVTSAEDEGFLQITVADTSVILSDRDQAELAACCRAEGTDLAEEGFRHMELRVARSLAELHGGRVWFEGEPGEGHTFHATLPIAQEPALGRLSSIGI